MLKQTHHMSPATIGWRRSALIGLFVFSLATAGQAQTPGQAQSKNVLFLSSYQIDLPVNLIAVQTLREEFQQAADLSLTVYYEYLDSNRFGDPAYQQAMFDLYARKYRGKPIDLVIVGSQQMLSLWLTQRTAILPETPVVFYDLSLAMLATLRMPPDVTGVAAEEDFTQSARWFLQMRPSVNEIVLVHGVGQADQPFLRYVDAVQTALAGQMRFTDWSALSLAEMKRRAAALPQTAVILYTLLFEDAAGVKYRPIDALRELAAVAAVPVLSGYDQFIGTGTLGGYMYSIEQQARVAAQMGLRILRGEPVSAIPALKNQSSRFIFDHRALQRWHIPLAALPPDSLVKNRQYSVWELYRLEISGIITGFGVLLALVAFLLRLTHQLQHARAALTALNLGLDAQVQARTAELRRVNDALQESETRFRVMFERHHAVMLLIEPESGRILDANRAAADFYGYPLETLRQMFTYEINMLPPDEIAAERQRALAEERNYFIFPHRLANHEIRTVEVHASPVIVNGQPLLFSIIHDITARKRAEEALQQAKEAAEAANRAKSVFLGHVSHHLRTPLNAVLGFADLIETQTTLSPKHQEYLRLIRQSGKELLALINHMLVVSKLDPNDPTFHAQSQQLFALLEGQTPPVVSEPPAAGLAACDADALRPHVRALPDELVQALRAAVEQLDITLMLRLIGQMRQTQPAVADALEQLAQNFDYANLLRLLEETRARDRG